MVETAFLQAAFLCCCSGALTLDDALLGRGQGRPQSLVVLDLHKGFVDRTALADSQRHGNHFRLQMSDGG